MVDVIAVTIPSFAAECQFGFERHWRDVFRFVLALTHDLGEAEHITQHAFARLWQARPDRLVATSPAVAAGRVAPVGNRSFPTGAAARG